MVPPPPPQDATELPYGTRLNAGMGGSTVLADMDFETYSEAGYTWTGAKWQNAGRFGGLTEVGVQVYAEHESTDVLMLAYDLKDGKGPRLWTPDLPNPTDLFEHLQKGLLVEAFNSTFEERIWNFVCTRKYGWPLLNPAQLRCAAAKSRAFCLPPNLDNAVKAAGGTALKDAEGKKLIRHFCMPRKPTKNKPMARHFIEADPKGQAMKDYCVQDIAAEAALSAKVPDLDPFEQKYWEVDQECNRMGVYLDVEAIDASMYLLGIAQERGAAKLRELTGGEINSVSQNVALVRWLNGHGVATSSVNEPSVTAMLGSGTLPDVCRKVLEIKQELGSASVKKVYSMKNQCTKVGRLHDQFQYWGARTGRDSSRGVQLQNMPNSGPDVKRCDCGVFFSTEIHRCPHCKADASFSSTEEWGDEAMEFAIQTIKDGTVGQYFGDISKVLPGCLRGFIMSAPGHDFICSDYSSIEAVVAACLADETWRIEAFRQKRDIYLLSASKLTGTPYEAYLQYKADTGNHHPDRRKLGKVGELASGYQGWLGAWKQFGADKLFDNDYEIKQKILAWRDASPNIVEAWGGQTRGYGENRTYELYGLEGTFIQAMMNPGVYQPWKNGVGYVKHGENVYCVLPSGRKITYHKPFLTWDAERGSYKIKFWGWNTNPKMGPKGWVVLDTYGGRLFENVVQGVARDIMVHAAVRLNDMGYKIRLRVHDELATHVPEGWGSVAEMERVAAELPEWARGWPIRASGGWRGKRFRK